MNIGDEAFKEFLENANEGRDMKQFMPVLLLLKAKADFIMKSCDFLMKIYEKGHDNHDTTIQEKLKETYLKVLEHIPQTLFQYDISVMDMEEDNDNEEEEKS